MNTSVHFRRHCRRTGGALARLLRYWWLPILCVPAAQGAAASERDGISAEQVYQLALEARSVRDYDAMLALLRQAAQADELAAQELLASVLLAGPALYGNALQADACEAAYWIGRASAAGSQVALHQARLLNGLRDGPEGRYRCAQKAG